jgi:hypothetical protein
MSTRQSTSASVTGAGRAIVPGGPRPSRTTMPSAQTGQRVSAAVVLTFILLCTVISLYDLLLLLKLLGR